MLKKFFCSNCLNTYEGEVDYNISFQIKDERIKPNYCVEFVCSCECGNTMYEIDNGIFELIVRLNKLGFYTEYCCEGHWNEGNFTSFPYIKFTCDDEKFRDSYSHKMENSEEFLLFLEQNLRKELYAEYDTIDTSISINLDTRDMTNDEINDLCENETKFEYYKELFLKEIERIICILEGQNTKE